jgi:hypothetical protein
MSVPIASTNTASYSPKIKVDAIRSKPKASPKGFGRSPTIVFSGAVKTFVPRTWHFFRCQGKRPLKAKIGRPEIARKVAVKIAFRNPSINQII